MEYVLKRIESDNEEVIQTTLEEFNEKVLNWAVKYYKSVGKNVES